MDTNMLGFKELFDVVLKATTPIKIDNRTIEAGEPIAIFKSVQFGAIDEFRENIHARGGFGNSSHISWNATKEIYFDFSQGVFSRLHLALLGNSKIISDEIYEAPMVEEAQVDDDSMIQLKHTPIEKTLFLYNDDGERVTNYILNGNQLIFENDLKYEWMDIIYSFMYNNGVKSLKVGQRLLEGYMELCGKTRLKDDRTGKTVTGIIHIPKIKLMSDMSIRLGKDAPPVTGHFKTVGFPVGSKGNEEVMSLVILNDDIDSDIG